MTKKQLIDLVLTEDEKRNVDEILSPANFTIILDLWGVDATRFYVTMKGKPVNLAELYVERFLHINPATREPVDDIEQSIEEAIRVLNEAVRRNSLKMKYSK